MYPPSANQSLNTNSGRSLNATFPASPEYLTASTDPTKSTAPVAVSGNYTLLQDVSRLNLTGDIQNNPESDRLHKRFLFQWKSRMAKKKTAARKVALPANKEQTAIQPPPQNKKKTPEATAASLLKIDTELISLIAKRANLTQEMLRGAPDLRSAVFSPPVDEALRSLISTNNPGPLCNDTISTIFRHVISDARKAIRGQRVAYLGPAFSHSHQAAIERFGESVDLIPVSTIASVFEDVNRGHADFGVVPIENSTDGRVVDTLDMFTRVPLRICGEVQLAIEHQLLAKCPRGEIGEIYSKPQAFSQCRNWLSRHMPNARLHDVTSTSTAAQLARDKPGAAAIASSRAAAEYGLQIVAASVQDNPHNVTRFAIIGDHQSQPTGRDRTAILLQIPHKPGSLADSLQAFKDNKINLSWIESFPLRAPESGYLFFLDFEGHSSDARIKKAIDQIAKNAVRVEILGSYPRSEVGTDTVAAR